MKPYILAGIITVSGLASAQTERSFTGTIADAACAKAGHDAMRMAPTDAECVVACVDTHGDGYALIVGDVVYALSGTPSPKVFAARRVTVVGTLDTSTNTITVTSMTAAR